MLSPEDANLLAEDLMVQYLDKSGATSAAEVGHALETLIGTAGRAHEKFVGNQEAVQVLSKTAHRIMAFPARVQKH